jgi:acetyltransferase-like isoleucine patch superfamily enzyme
LLPTILAWVSAAPTIAATRRRTVVDSKGSHMLAKIRRAVTAILFDLSWANIYLIAKLKTLNLPVIVFRSVHFRMGPGARIVRRQGRLRLGRKWDISRYRESELKICAGATLEIRGDMTVYTGCSIDVCDDATLSLGSGYINNGVRIVAFENIRIGDDVAISENVTFRDSDNHVIEGSDKPVTAPISIGDRVWIGINATILKGVTVGDGAIIAANSLVNKDVPPETLVAGVPAKVIRANVKWR